MLEVTLNTYNCNLLFTAITAVTVIGQWDAYKFDKCEWLRTRDSQRSVSNKPTTVKVRRHGSSISKIHKRCLIYWSSYHFKNKDFLRVLHGFSLMKTELLKLQATGCLRQLNISKYGACGDIYYSHYLKSHFHEFISF